MTKTEQEAAARAARDERLSGELAEVLVDLDEALENAPVAVAAAGHGDQLPAPIEERVILPPPPAPRATVLSASAEARKEIPLARGVLDYFPAALAAVAVVSKAGSDQHNPGQEMHHARGKSADHADCILRHLMDRGRLDTDGHPHSAKVAWRALALLQEELEAAGAPLARGARLPAGEGQR